MKQKMRIVPCVSAKIALVRSETKRTLPTGTSHVRLNRYPKAITRHASTAPKKTANAEDKRSDLRHARFGNRSFFKSSLTQKLRTG